MDRQFIEIRLRLHALDAAVHEMREWLRKKAAERKQRAKELEELDQSVATTRKTLGQLIAKLGAVLLFLLLACAPVPPADPDPCGTAAAVWEARQKWHATETPEFARDKHEAALERARQCRLRFQPASSPEELKRIDLETDERLVDARLALVKLDVELYNCHVPVKILRAKNIETLSDADLHAFRAARRGALARAARCARKRDEALYR